MPRLYFTLLARDDASQPWTIQFGAYRRWDVALEMQSQRDARAFKYFRVIQSSDSQESIDAAVFMANETQV